MAERDLFSFPPAVDLGIPIVDQQTAELHAIHLALKGVIDEQTAGVNDIAGQVLSRIHISLASPDTDTRDIVARMYEPFTYAITLMGADITYLLAKLHQHPNEVLAKITVDVSQISTRILNATHSLM